VSYYQQLKKMGIILPTPATPVASYVAFRRIASTVYISGQLPFVDGKLLYPGKVGESVPIEEAKKASKFCALNLISQLESACDGDLERVIACVKLGGFVQSTSDFTAHPTVINGASDLMVEIFGDAGRHARFAVGAPSLPLNSSVEIDGIFEIRL